MSPARLLLRHCLRHERGSALCRPGPGPRQLSPLSLAPAGSSCRLTVPPQGPALPQPPPSCWMAGVAALLRSATTRAPKVTPAGPPEIVQSQAGHVAPLPRAPSTPAYSCGVQGWARARRAEPAAGQAPVRPAQWSLPAGEGGFTACCLGLSLRGPGWNGEQIGKRVPSQSPGPQR